MAVLKEAKELPEGWSFEPPYPVEETIVTKEEFLEDLAKDVAEAELEELDDLDIDDNEPMIFVEFSKDEPYAVIENSPFEVTNLELETRKHCVRGIKRDIRERVIRVNDSKRGGRNSVKNFIEEFIGTYGSTMDDGSKVCSWLEIAEFIEANFVTKFNVKVDTHWADRNVKLFPQAWRHRSSP